MNVQTIKYFDKYNQSSESKWFHNSDEMKST